MQAEGAVDAAHPLGVAAGQEVVDGDDVDAAPAQRVQEGGHGGGQRLALAGLHLGYPAAVHGGGAEHLHVEVALPEPALGGLAHQGVGLRLDVFQRLAHAQAPAQLRGGPAQLRVAALLQPLLQRPHPRRDGADGPQPELVHEDVMEVGEQESVLTTEALRTRRTARLVGHRSQRIATDYGKDVDLVTRPPAVVLAVTWDCAVPCPICANPPLSVSKQVVAVLPVRFPCSPCLRVERARSKVVTVCQHKLTGNGRTAQRFRP